MSFEKLLETMGTLAKAQPSAETTTLVNKKIQEAAADDENDDDQTNADNNGGGDGLAADGMDATGALGKGKPLNKSFLLTMADGSEMEAFDGTEMLKSLTARLDASEGELAAEKQRGQATEDKVLKSLQAAVGLIAVQAETLKTQETMIKSLNERMGVLSSTGRGIRSVRAVTDISGKELNKSLNKSLAGGHGEAMSNQQILAKSLGAMKAGRISGLDATRIETSINLGVPVPAELLSAISGN